MIKKMVDFVDKESLLIDELCKDCPQFFCHRCIIMVEIVLKRYYQEEVPSIKDITKMQPMLCFYINGRLINNAL